MPIRSILAMTTLLALAPGAQAAQPAFYYESIWGTYEVTGVSVADSPIQALVENDPQYMGATISFTKGAITWTKGTDTRPIDPAIDNCTDPSFIDAAGSYVVNCGTEPWGPGATLTPLSDTELSLTWYDGGTLTLTRRE